MQVIPACAHTGVKRKLKCYDDYALETYRPELNIYLEVDWILLGTQFTCTNTKLKNIKMELQSDKKEILHNLAEQNIKDNKSTKDSPKSFQQLG